jgi:hypothetical protein
MLGALELVLILSNSCSAVEDASEALRFSHGFLMRSAQPLIVAFAKSKS